MKFRRKGCDATKKVVEKSFGPTLIDLRETTPGKAAIKPPDDKQDIGGQTKKSSPQKKGQDFHEILADKIKKGTRVDRGGVMLKKMEDKFSCEFIKAEVSISGYAVKGKTQVDLWSGRMDAVAISEKDVVFVVDWKTSSKPDFETDWWEMASNFKKPLYQCLVYRELLRAHFKRNDVDAKVGILLAPFHLLHPEEIYPGLCVDFQEMDKEHLLDNLKDFQWFPVLDKSIYSYTIELPCKLFGSFDPAAHVDQSTNILKDDTRLKSILNDNATVADLLRCFGFPFLKVEGIKKEEKTNEELEEVNKKCLRHVVMTAKFSVLNKPENNQHGVTLSL